MEWQGGELKPWESHSLLCTLWASARGNTAPDPESLDGLPDLSVGGPGGQGQTGQRVTCSH